MIIRVKLITSLQIQQICLFNKTINGSENIKCKIDGELSDDMKNKVLDKTFELADRITNNQYQLQCRSIYYEALNVHLFKYDNENDSYYEVDVEKEMKKKIQNYES